MKVSCSGLGATRVRWPKATHLVRLRGALIEKHPDFINIHPSLLNDVADIAIEHKVRLIGQVHSHGPGYWLDLSPTDREYGIRASSYLSLVAPDYGNTNASIQHWGVHVYADCDGYLRRKSARSPPSDPECRAARHLPFLTVGGAQ